ncbi:MAG: twin-arginine translocase TatA/TatE family subunit [Candidatus Acidiferrales bacterium]
MEFSWPHLLILLLVVVILFGGKKIPEVMRGLGSGVREFREGMRGDQSSQTNSTPTSTSSPAPTSQPTTPEKK